MGAKRTPVEFNYGTKTLTGFTYALPSRIRRAQDSPLWSDRLSLFVVHYVDGNGKERTARVYAYAITVLE